MNVALTLDLPIEIYDLLVQFAKDTSLTPEEWIIASLRRQLIQPVRDQNLRRLFGSANLGRPLGLENSSLDTDLVHEYASVDEG